MGRIDHIHVSNMAAKLLPWLPEKEITNSFYNALPILRQNLMRIAHQIYMVYPFKRHNLKFYFFVAAAVDSRGRNDVAVLVRKGFIALVFLLLDLIYSS